MKASLGFTLIELVVTLTVLAILATVALPSYQNFVLTQRVRGASYDLMTSLVFARSEAIKRNASVSMTQAAGGWAQGWTVSAGALTLRTPNPYGRGGNHTHSAAPTTNTYPHDVRLACPPNPLSVS